MEGEAVCAPCDLVFISDTGTFIPWGQEAVIECRSLFLSDRPGVPQLPADCAARPPGGGRGRGTQPASAQSSGVQGPKLQEPREGKGHGGGEGGTRCMAFSLQSFMVKDRADRILAMQLLPLDTEIALMSAEQSRALPVC